MSINGHHADAAPPDPFGRRRARFRDRMEELRKRLPFVDDPAARAIMAGIIDELEELLRV